MSEQNKELIANEQLDNYLDWVLKPAGSARRNYTMESTITSMRDAMKTVISHAVNEATALLQASDKAEAVGHISRIDPIGLIAEFEMYLLQNGHYNFDVGDKLYTSPQPLKSPEDEREAFEIIDANNVRHRFNRVDGYFWQYALVEAGNEAQDKSVVEVMHENDDGFMLVKTFPNIAAVGDITIDTCLSLPEKQLCRCPRCGFVEVGQDQSAKVANLADKDMDEVHSSYWPTGDK